MTTDNQYTELLRLWVFRIFATPKNISRLINKRGYRDDDITRFLGLSDWDDTEEAQIESAYKKMEFSERHQQLETKADSIRMPEHIHDNFLQLSRIVRATPSEARIMEFLAVRQTESVFMDTFNVLDNLNLQGFTKVVARALKISPQVVRESLSPKSHLVRSGIVRLKENVRMAQKLPGLFSSGIAESLLTEAFDRKNLLRGILTPSVAPTLSYRDYPHQRKNLKLLRPYLRKVLKSGKSGVNIFIHGIPGTGKSELARVLAREMRCLLFEVSSEDKDGDPILPPQRLFALRMANSLLSKRAILVFDEAEDIFNDGSIFHPSTAQIRKAWMNRMLESNKVPTIWISNSANGLDPANVRRFDFVFELENPPRKQRERTYRKICSSIVSDQTIQRISESDALAPAVVARATHVVQSIKDQLPKEERDSAFLQLIDNTLKAQGNRKGIATARSSALPKVYGIQYLNCEMDLQKVGERLCRLSSCRICLYGPPGTGKTSFAHWLAKSLERPLHVKRASDILSPYVGMTEQNFARTFEKAREENAILLLDEVDTFLQDRRQAVRSWEVSQVNEMLTQMEAFEGTFIASTNLMDNLDQAALRRFDLKLYFDYLQPEKAVELFNAYCRTLKLGKPTAANINQVSHLNTLTPGDFANVARQHAFRQFPSPAAFLDAALDECRIKGISAKTALGFG
jgi:SpoVK/Ycf46/Vps4 family AAA+-type ATPase